MASSIVFVLLGIFLLYLGAELLVRSAIGLAKHLKIPRLIIGLTVVAFATSMPEALVSIFAQLNGASGDVALGNVLGSNSANIGLVLGAYLLMSPSQITKELTYLRMPTMLFVYLLVFFVMLGGHIIRLEGIYLLIVLALYLAFQFLFPPKKTEIDAELKVHDGASRPMKLPLLLFSCFASVVILIFGTRFLLNGSLSIARTFSISERVISVTLIAFGTSLPELATAFVAAFRKEKGLVVGTVIGSNIFNPLLILPCLAFIRPVTFSPKMLLIDFSVMAFFSLLLWSLMIRGKSKLSRFDGLVLTVCYLIYATLLYV